MKLYIKYMVSLRCKMVVKEELKKLGINHIAINLGQVELMEQIKPEQLEQLRVALKNSGLELMDDKKSVLIEKIKDVIIEMVHYEDEMPKVNFSDYLAEKLDYNYTYLANLFHGGEPHLNRDRTRKSMVLHYFREGAICYHEITQRPALLANIREEKLC